jgi:hypothetical protein
MGLASQPATAQCKPLPMAPGDNAPDKRLNRPAYRAQPPAARQIRHKPKFNLESGNAEHVKPSHMKPLDNSKFISPHQNLAPKTAGPTIKISLEICSACEIKKWNVSILLLD